MTPKLDFKQSLTAGLFAGIASAIVNAILFFLFHGIGVFTDDIMIQPNQPLTVVAIIISSILPLIIGSIVFFAIERFTNNGYKIFTVVAIAFAIISMIPPFKIQGATTNYAVALCALHIVPVVFILYFIKRQKQKYNDKIN